jgi:hypothetical protein
MTSFDQPSEGTLQAICRKLRIAQQRLQEAPQFLPVFHVEGRNHVHIQRLQRLLSKCAVDREPTVFSAFIFINGGHT